MRHRAKAGVKCVMCYTNRVLLVFGNESLITPKAPLGANGCTALAVTVGYVLSEIPDTKADRLVLLDDT